MKWDRRLGTVAALGLAQTLAWASSYYLPAMLAVPMARDLGLSAPTVFAAFSVALIVSALVGPLAGKAVDRHGGRPVLMLTNLLFAAGLAALGLAQGPADLFAAWLVLGVAMGCGLYEAAFASLVRLYGPDARGAITGITLIAGFASTVGWPLSTLLQAELGWRGTCFTWAVLHIVLGLPLNAWVPGIRPRQVAAPQAGTVVDVPPASVATASAAAAATRARPAGTSDSAASPAQAPVPRHAALILSFAFAATAFISTAMAAHLPQLLQAAGTTLAAAVFVGALIGPAQVGARLLEFGWLRRMHPLLGARLALAAHPLGALVLVVFGAPAAAVFGVLHGAGNGILTIARGTLPLVIFGAQGYGHRQGLLMLPARVAQALAPWLFGLCLARWGSGALALSATLGALAAGALLLLPMAAKPPSTEVAP